jgi:tetratricopeptide (TPR) repeat protein
MKSAESRSYGRIAISVLLSAVLLAGTISFTASSAGRPDSDNWEKTRSAAESQHEIVMLLLSKKEYDNALAEANKIFDMRWPDSQEALLLKELLLLSDQFLKHSQARLGLQLINRNSRCCKSTSSQIEILKQTGYLYKSLNENDKALDCFRKARELENHSK